MSIREVVAGVLLAVGIWGFAMNSIGLLLSEDLFDQIHYLAPGSLLGAVAIPAAVLVQEGLNQAGAKAIAIAVLLCLANPVLSHATARAGRIRRRQKLAPQESEDIPVVKAPR